MNVEVVVIGGGMGGLCAALACARNGVAPLLVEQRGRVGGLVCGAPVGGTMVDLGAESYANRSAFITGLVDELGLERLTPQVNSWIWSQHGCHRIPFGVLGIPADPTDPDVVAALGPDAAAAAARDLTLGPEPGADAEDLASLVRARMGDGVLERFVRPIAGGVHSVEPSQLAADSVTPGLRQALADEGSLARAAASLRARAGDAPMVASVVGGLFRLPAAMADAVEAAGGTVRTRTVVTGLRREGDAWQVTLHPAAPGATPADDPVPSGEPEIVTARHVVVALPGAASWRLLRSIPELQDLSGELPAGAQLAGATLALRHPALDDAPRGSGLLVAPDTPGMRAKALTHYSVKWPWARPQPDAPHIVRVSYGRAGQPRPQVSVEQAVADAATLLDVPLTGEHCEGGIVAHWPDSLPPHTPSHRRWLAQVGDAVDAVGGLSLAGSWVAGTGLAAVMPHGYAVGEAVSS